jgi:hypothetical protein
MPRYEPKRNAMPLIKEGATLKMRRTADGRWEPASVTPPSRADDDAPATERPEPPAARDVPADD